MIKLGEEFEVSVINTQPFLEVWEPTKEQASNGVACSGAILNETPGKLVITSKLTGNIVPIKQNLASPRMAKRFPDVTSSANCRFKSEPTQFKQGDTLHFTFFPEDGGAIVLAELKRVALYNANFYQSQKEGSKLSAQQYFSYLFEHYKPKSLVDFGCGVGTWIKQAHEMGVEKVLGLDGLWTQNVDNFFDGSVVFKEANLNELQTLPNKFDMAMSLEVAEHLESSSSENFVNSLCNAANVILFGAAYVGQPGKDHINCQKHSFWAELFFKRQYQVFDLYRSRFWGDTQVEPWYQQNTFLYVKTNTPVFNKLLDQGYKPLDNVNYMDVVHPWLYHRYCNHNEK